MLLDTTFAGIAAVAGIVTAAITWLALPRRRLTALCDGLVVVEPRSGLRAPIEVRFGGELVFQVTRTLLYIWNSGNRELTNADIAAGDPLRIRVSNKDARILAANVIRCSQEGLGVGTEPYTETERRLVFDRLPCNHGVIVEVYHTAPEPALMVIGTVPAAGKIKNRKSRGAYFDDARKGRSALWLGGWTIGALGIMIGGMLVAASLRAKLDLYALLPWLPMAIGETFFLLLLPDFIAKLQVPRSLRILSRR